MLTKKRAFCVGNSDAVIFQPGFLLLRVSEWVSEWVSEAGWLAVLDGLGGRVVRSDDDGFGV